MVLKRAFVCELHEPGTIPSVNIAKPVRWPYSHDRSSARCRAARSSSASRSSSSCPRRAARRRHRAGVCQRHRHGRRPGDRGRRRVLSRPAVSSRQAPPAVARAPQADPLLHLHRLRAGDPHRRVLPALRRCCCSSTSARTWCRAESARSSDRARLVGARAPRSRFSATGGRDVARIARRGRRACSAEFPGVVDRRRPGRPAVRVAAHDAERSAPSTVGVDGEVELAAGPWAHVDPPTSRPGVDWLRRASRGCSAALADRERVGRASRDACLVRGVAFPDSPTPGYAVIVDLP